MKKLKYLFILLITPIFLLSKNVSALSFSSTGRINLTSGIIAFSGISTTITGSTSAGGLHFSFNQPGYNVNSVQLCYSGTIPANSILNFSVSTDNPYRPFQPTRNAGNYSVLSVQYGEYGRTSISLYFSASMDSCFYINPLDFPNGYNGTSAISLNISRLNYITLNAEPTASQIEDIKTKLDDFNTIISNIEDYVSDINTDVSHISTVIDGIYTRVGNILNTNTTISNNVLLILREIQSSNSQEQQDRDNIETQQENNESDAQDKEDEADETGQTLMGAFSSLITALGNVHTTNCKLPNMSVYSIELKNMDLCTVNMPSGVSALAGIAMSLIIIKMGYSLVKRMLNLYKEIIG